MSLWRHYSLKDLLIEKGYIRGPFGSSLKRNEMETTGVPVYEQQHAIYDSRVFRFFINDEKFIELKRFQVKDDDLIISCSGTIGSVSIINHDDPKGIISQALLLLRPNTRVVYPEYLFYFFRSSIGFNHLVNASEGSVQPNISSRKIVESIPIRLPDLQTQKIVIDILKSLDDKIDLLHRQNKTLEQLAETMFTQIFVQDEENLWPKGTLPDEFDFVMGQSPLGSQLNENGNGMIFFQGRTDFDFRFPIERMYTTSPTRIAKPFDTLISVRAPVGDMNMALHECCIGRGVAAFRYKVDNQFYSYTYYKLRSLMIQIKQFEDNGTVFGSIGKEDFNKLEVPLPPKKLIEEFQQFAKPIDDKIFSNSAQISTLENLRNLLLPKLMSGETEIDNETEN
jgi:type I restriction enzyme S subunit